MLQIPVEGVRRFPAAEHCAGRGFRAVGSECSVEPDRDGDLPREYCFVFPILRRHEGK